MVAGMKVAFVGKGGSGKTTISSLFSRYLASQGALILVIDADINQHMGVALGMTPAEAALMPPMGLEMDRIKSYLRGTNERISSDIVMAKTTPPGSGSRLVRLAENNPIYDHFVREMDGVRLMAVGPFGEEDLGVKCYHSKTGAAEVLLSHMIDDEDEYLVMDMTAGADSFASGLFTKFDMTFLVVEPTLKSLSVYRQYKQYAKDHDVAIRVIGNKVEDHNDRAFIQKHIGSDLIACVSRSKYILALEKGNWQSLRRLEPENLQSLELIKQVVDALEKDWRKFYRQTVEFHVRNARSWANESAGKDLTEQIDPDFDLSKVI
jgi:CO dehydrogenase maturation factor